MNSSILCHISHTIRKVQLDVDDVVLEFGIWEAPDLAEPVGPVDSVGVVLRGGWSAEDLHCHMPSVSRLVLGCCSGAGCTVSYLSTSIRSARVGARGDDMVDR